MKNDKTHSRRATMLGASVLAAVATPHAQAQDSARTLAQLEEVVVTAQKREERLLDVPVSVAVVSAAALSAFGQNETVDLAYRVPSLGVSNSAGPRSFGFFIRGIGTTSFASESIESSSAFVVDGVVLGQAGASLTDLPDIERVEVLRGPQGTLFGKNASAGVINVVTKRPSETFEAVANLTWADPDNDSKVSGYISGPISDEVRYLLSARFNRRDGMVENIHDGRDLNDRNDQGVRGRIEIEPADNFRLTLIGDWWKRRADCCIWTMVSTGTPINPVEQAYLDRGFTIDEDNKRQNIDGQVFSDVDSWGFSAQADYDFAAGYTFTSISAYRYWKTVDGLDSDNSPLPVVNENYADFRQNQFTQEFRVASPTGGWVDYVAGLFFFNSKVHSESAQLRPLETGLFRNLIADNFTTSQNAAVFGQANVNFTDDFRLIIGGRYLSELSEAEKVRLDPVNDHVERNDADKTDRAFLWRAGLQYDITDDSNIFATVTRGYKGGGYDVGIGTTALREITPEEPTNYEVGIRAAFPSARLLFNLTAFHQEVEDLQVTAREPGTVGAFLLLNAAVAESKGVEAELMWRPLDGLSLNASLAYLDGTYKTFRGAPCYRGQTVATGCVAGEQDMSGRPLPFAPEWSANLDARYEHSLGASGLSLFVNGNVNYRSEFPANTPYDPNTFQEGFALLNGALGIGSDDGRWSLSVFGRNLTDKYYVTRKFNTVGVPGLGAYSVYSPYEAQRILGVSFEVRYD